MARSQVSFRFEEAGLTKLKQLAEAKKMTSNEYARMVLESYINLQDSLQNVTRPEGMYGALLFGCASCRSFFYDGMDRSRWDTDHAGKGHWVLPIIGPPVRWEEGPKLT
jgi:hypothetical protein